MTSRSECADVDGGKGKNRVPVLVGVAVEIHARQGEDSLEPKAGRESLRRLVASAGQYMQRIVTSGEL